MSWLADKFLQHCAAVESVQAIADVLDSETASVADEAADGSDGCKTPVDEPLRLLAGYRVDSATGLLIRDDAFATNWEPMHVRQGERVTWPKGRPCQIWVYTQVIDEMLVHTYCYAPEDNWTSFQPGLSQPMSREGMWTAPQDCFVRVTAQLHAGSCGSLVDEIENGTSGNAPVEGSAADGDMADAVESVLIKRLPAACEEPLPCFIEERSRVAERTRALQKPGDLVFLLVSDIHYATGCPWPDTARNLQAVAKALQPDAVVQLGDLTDGVAPKHVTLSMAKRVLVDLSACGVPVLGCVGNHDWNRFRLNVDGLDSGECARRYLGRETPWYAVDFPDQGIRALFLDSFDPDECERYGFPRRMLRWVRSTLAGTPQGWGVLVFSHVPPLPAIHYWSNTIRNGDRLMQILERFDARRSGAVLAFVHGHNHADQVFSKKAFPIVSIGCAKLEDFQDRKPVGAITQKRALGTVSQDLWDVMVVHPDLRSIDFVRFGAGDDRQVGRA